MTNKESLSKIIKEARTGLSKYISLDDEDIEHCRIGSPKGGTTLTTIGVRQNSLIYIHKGELAMVTYSTTDSRISTMGKEVRDGKKKFVKFNNELRPIFYQSQGTVIGTWSLITHSTNYYAAMVPKGQKAIIFEVPAHIVKKQWKKNPLKMMPLMKIMLNKWSKVARRIDYCIQWSFVGPGKVIYRRGDPKISTYLVLSGRLRFKVRGQYIYEKRMELEAKTKFGHYEAGDWFGFVECVNSTQMQKTVVADRYSEVLIN